MKKSIIAITVAALLIAALTLGSMATESGKSHHGLNLSRVCGAQLPLQGRPNLKLGRSYSLFPPATFQ